VRRPGDSAKLISSNDDIGFTYRGRFKEPEEAASVSSEVTQKAHSALRWLISRQAYAHGSQVFVAWCVALKPVPDPWASTDVLFGDSEDNEEGSRAGFGAEDVSDIGQAFSRRLAKTIAGYHAELGPTDEIVVMGVDSATPGRLAVTFYRELTGSSFLERITRWHECFAWPQRYPDRRPFCGAPAPHDIAEAAHGLRLDKRFDKAGDEKLLRATVERILPCIIDGRRLPRDLMEAAVRRASRQRVANRSNRKEDQELWEKLLGVSCSLFKGYHVERSYRMALEVDRTTRDYLYGRLLAIAEHIEARALWISDENRDTTAAKLMARFADRPYATWLTIEKSLQPYMTRLQSRSPGFLAWAKGLMDEVHCKFACVEDYMDNRALSGEYLLGYHCQRAALKGSKASVESGEGTEVVESEKN
jgi:CRISPR-associated protein Csd1